MKRISLIAALLLLSKNIASAQPEADSVYLFSYFKGNGDGLHLAYSYDGYQWEALKEDQLFLEPAVGNDKLMRDPCIIRGGDGRFHMVWTVSWNEKGLGYAHSEDLINWSEQQYIPVMEQEPNSRNVWAPEITYDNATNSYLIYWATTIRGAFPETQSDKDDGYSHRIYYTVTEDFKDFSETAMLYEPSFNVIDATIVPYSETFIMFLKDETREPAEKNIRIAKSKNLTGPYSEASAPITGDYWAEGPTTLRMNGSWIVYFDKYTEHAMGAVKSDDLENWDDISSQIAFPEGMRHGSIFKVGHQEFQKLKQ